MECIFSTSAAIYFFVLSKRQILPECANARFFDYSDNKSIYIDRIYVKIYLQKRNNVNCSEAKEQSEFKNPGRPFLIFPGVHNAFCYIDCRSME